jgi:hypothetical protein
MIQMNNVQHFSKLKTGYPAQDIVGWGTKSQNLRNGSALFYNNSTNTGKHTGFGLFKDNIGNLIVVADENQQASRELLKGELFGFGNRSQLMSSCPVINIGTDYKDWLGRGGSDAKTRVLQLRAGNIESNSGMTYSGNWQSEKNKQGIKPTQFNFYDVLTNIESTKEKFNSPIIIYREYTESSLGFTDILGYALAIAGNFAPMLKLDPKIFQQASGILKAIDLKKPIKYRNLGEIFDSLRVTAEIVVPEWTKGDSAFYKNNVPVFGQYLDKARSGFDAIENNLSSDLLNIAVSQTGVDKNELRKYFKNISKGEFDEVVNLTRINGSLNNANKILANVSATYTNQLIKNQIGSGELLMKIGSSNSINNVPVINNLFQSGSAGTILQGVADVKSLIPALVKKEISKLDNNSIAGLVGANFGYVGPEENFDQLTLNALISQAQEYAIKNIPFVLPDTINPSKRQYFADEVSKQANVQVVGYQEGWDWSTSRGKMVALGVAVGGFYLAKKKKLI